MIRFYSSGGHVVWRCVFAVILGALLTPPARAQTWDGGGVAGGPVTWSTAANWNPDGVPVNNGTANIIMANNIDTVNTVDVNFDINSLTFNNTAGAFQIANAGGAILTVRGGGITNNDAQQQGVILPLAVAANQTWNAAAGSMNYLAVNLNTNQLTLSSANDHFIGSGITGATGSIVKNGSGIVTLSSSASTFGGGFTLNSGTLRLNAGAGLLGTGTVSLNGGSVEAFTSPRTVTNILTLGGNFSTIGSQQLTLSGPATLTGNRAIFTDNTGITEFSGAIGQDALGRSLTKAGAGTLRFSGGAANTYTGTTTVNVGTLELMKTDGVNAIAGGFLSVGDGTGGANSDIVRLLANNQILNSTNVVVLTSGLFDLNGFSESLSTIQVFGGNVVTGAGTLTLTSQIFHESSPDLTSTITGNLSLGTASNVQFTIEDGTPTTDLNVSAAISGSGQITKSLPGTLEFSGSTPNNYTGLTTVAAGTLLLNKSDGVVAVPNDLFISGGTVSAISQDQFAGSTDAIISNFGFLAVSDDNTIASLTLSDGVVAPSLAALTVSGPISVNNTASNSSFIQGTGTLVLTGAGNDVFIADGAAANDLEIFPAVISTTGLTKTGSGQLLLNGNAANSIAGTTSINEGTLFLQKASANTAALGGNIVVGDGLGGADADVLRLGENHQIAQLVTETLTVNSSGFFDLNGRTETIGNLQLNAGRVSGGTIGFTGTVTSSAQNTTAQINSHIDLLGSFTFFTVNDGTAGDDLLMDGTITNGAFSKNGAGTLKLAGANPNTATLSQVIVGTVILEKNAGVNALGGSQVVISGGLGPVILRYGANDHQLSDSFQVTVQTGGLFDLNGRSDTIGTLNMNGTGDVQTGAGTLTIASQVLSSLSTTAGTINGNLNLNGGLRPFNIANSAIPAIDLTVTAAMSNGTLQKQGLGALQLTGGALASPISYQLDVGTLSASGLVVGATRSFTQNAGAFSGSLTNHSSFTYNGGTFSGQWNNKATGTATFNADFTATNGIDNEGAITIDAGRTLTASGTGLFNDGTINLAGGTLAASSTTNFNNNGTITGHGTISASNVNFFSGGDISVSGGDLTINSNFSPINLGTITIPNNLELQLAGTGNTQNNGLILLNGGHITGTGGLSNLLGGEIRGGSGVQTPLTNSGGLIRATGTGTLTLSNLTGNSAGGELRVDDGATMNVQNAFSSSGTIVLSGSNATLSGGTITNTGTIRGPGRINNPVANSGTIRAENGTLTLPATGHTNTASGRFEAGASTQLLFSQGLATNSGQIALTGGAFDNNNVALANPGSIEGYGTVRTGGLTNSGTISVGGSLDVLGPVTQNATVSTQTGTTVRFFGPVTGPGSYPGAGTVMFLNIFSPGASPAAVSFGGDMVLAGSSNLIIELAGTTPGSQFDTLTVGGAATLAGGLEIDLLSGFVPAHGNTFQFISATGGVDGTFGNVALPALANANWQLIYNPTSVQLRVALVGDYNFNGVVDAADYVLWRKTVGQTGIGLAADGNANNQVDPGDFDVWRAHFGQTTGSGSGANANAAIPEPASVVLLILSTTCLYFRRRQPTKKNLSNSFTRGTL